MTYKEKLMKEHPECVDDSFYGECRDCPETYGYEEVRPDFCNGSINEDDCIKCWNREMSKGCASDMKKQFTKADLKAGNMCKTRNGDIYMWLNNKLYCQSEIEGLEYTKDDLKNEACSKWDVVQVRDSSVLGGADISVLFRDFEKLPVIWERSEEVAKKEVSAEEINAILKEKFPGVDEFVLLIND